MESARDAQPRWAVAYGAEFWRRRDPGARSRARRKAALPASTDVRDVISRVSHAWRSTQGAPSVRAEDPAYVATLDRNGLRFSPKRPDPTAQLRIRTSRVAVAGREVYRAEGSASWSVRGNTAQALLARDEQIVEHYETRDEGVELTWVWRQRPPLGAADLMVEVAIDGLAYAGESSAGLHFADAANIERVRIGTALLIDADGERWAVPARRTAGGLRWTVAAETIAEARFPLALDPIIAPEFAMDEPVLMPTARDDQIHPSVASDGTNYLVVWQNGNADYGIVGARVSGSGVVLDPLGIGIAPSAVEPIYPSVASNGSEFLVAWSDQRHAVGADGWEIYGSRVSSAGEVLDPTGVPIATPPGYALFPAVASNGSEFLVVWEDLNGIRGVRVASDATVLDAIDISSTDHQLGRPRVASNGSDFLIVWHDMGTGSVPDVYGRRVSAAGQLLGTQSISITNTPSSELHPAVASDGTNYFVVWQHFAEDGSWVLEGSRVDATGALLDAPANSYATSTSAISESGNYLPPSVAWSAAGYLLAWLDREDDGSFSLDIRRVGAGGDALASSTTIGSVDEDDAPWICLASNGIDYLVVSQDKPSTSDSIDIYGVRVSGTGALLDAQAITISTGPNQEATPAVASNDSGYLVVWLDDRSGTGRDIYGVRVDGTGAVLDPSAIAISTGTARWDKPAVASDGTDYLVVWSDTRGGSSIYGSRIDGSGAVLDVDGIPFSSGTTLRGGPAVASNGLGYLVTWGDARGVPAYSDIYGMRVDLNGSVLDADGIPISTAVNHQGTPSVAAKGSDYLVAWVDSRSDSAGDIYGSRVDLDGVVLDPNGISICTLAGKQQDAPSVASNGSDYFVVWNDDRSTVAEIYGARIDASGALLDSGGRLISRTTRRQYPPSVASNGADYLVAWYNCDVYPPEHCDIVGTRVDAAGDHLEPKDFSVAASDFRESFPAVAYNASTRGYLVAYERGARIHGRIVSICGDGFVGGSESCDGDGIGHGGETATCDVDCTAVVCGDGVVNEMAGEVCDNGHPNANGCGTACAASDAGTAGGADAALDGAAAETDSGIRTDAGVSVTDSGVRTDVGPDVSDRPITADSGAASERDSGVLGADDEPMPKRTISADAAGCSCSLSPGADPSQPRLGWLFALVLGLGRIGKMRWLRSRTSARARADDAPPRRASLA